MKFLILTTCIVFIALFFKGYIEWYIMIMPWVLNIVIMYVSHIRKKEKVQSLIELARGQGANAMMARSELEKMGY